MTQIALLCGCGGAPECERCRRRAQHSRQHFAGEREAVLRRDDWQCQVCGEISAGMILVHHRTPGARSRRLMITLCRRCHPRAHYTASPSAAVALETPLLYLLWRELHRRQPEQLLLAAHDTPTQQTFAICA